MPPASGCTRPSQPNVSASNRPPAVVTAHPSSAAPPNGASVAGSVKMPEPTMLPTTSALAISRPSGRASLRAGSPFTGRCSSVIAVRGPQQVVEVLHAGLPLRAQPPGVIAARRQSALHRLADRDVLGLHFVAEREVLLPPRLFLRVAARRIEVVEVDAA